MGQHKNPSNMKVIIIIALLFIASQGADGLCSSCGSCLHCCGACIAGVCLGACTSGASTWMSVEEACLSNVAMIASKTGNKAACEACTDNATCAICTDKIEGDDELTEICYGIKESCFGCILKIIGAVKECINEPTIPQKAECILSKVPQDCKTCVCSFICSSSHLKEVCKFLQSIGECPK